MPATKATKIYIEKELPFNMLARLYADSRTSLRTLGRELNISYHVVQSALKNLEEKYKITYTLALDETKLGFTEGRVITIKFSRMPSIEALKERFNKDIFVQNAYLGQGDFDLLLYVVGLTNRDFDSWQFKLRVDFGEYKPNLRIAVLNRYLIGFFPLRNELLAESTVLDESEKRILLLLNENSRIKLGDLVKKSKFKQARVIYIMKKLREKGIINRYTTLVQEPDKHLFIACACTHTPVKRHDKLLLDFLEKLTMEDFHEAVNDYGLMCNTNGFCDLFFMCSFENGEVAKKRGPEILRDLWKDEDAKIEQVILTSLLLGKYPFHLETYGQQVLDIVGLRKSS